eukprot:1192782-Prorocentrum_minimum.AAC.2
MFCFVLWRVTATCAPPASPALRRAPSRCTGTSTGACSPTARPARPSPPPAPPRQPPRAVSQVTTEYMRGTNVQNASYQRCEHPGGTIRGFRIPMRRLTPSCIIPGTKDFAGMNRSQTGKEEFPKEVYKRYTRDRRVIAKKGPRPMPASAESTDSA